MLWFTTCPQNIRTEWQIVQGDSWHVWYRQKARNGSTPIRPLLINEESNEMRKGSFYNNNCWRGYTLFKQLYFWIPSFAIVIPAVPKRPALSGIFAVSISYLYLFSNFLLVHIAKPLKCDHQYSCLLSKVLTDPM